MAFDKDEIKQLKELFDKQLERFDVKLENLSLQFDKKLGKQNESFFKLINDEHSAISLEIKTVIQGVERELEDIKMRVDRLFEMESGDIKGAYEDIEFLKRRIKSLENRLSFISKR